ncbi:hypothetical protein J3454_14470 [Erythrobacter sp. NFXS35]|uniref:phage fiber-tail adaptor protein n=1 Tax=Erythrobacter sp. NFXS35 TaxID=2818436 RepID=UPI0032DEEC42
MNYEFRPVIKDPQAVQFHGMDWSTWLQEGETIADREVISSVADELVIDQVTDANGKVSWRVSGGTDGTDYLATCRITTSIGRIEDRSLPYHVRER